MSLRKLAALVPVTAALALAVPVASASAQTISPAPGSPQSAIPCYPYPAFCGPNGQPWLQYLFPWASNPGGQIVPTPFVLPALPTATQG
jgi:hypothetical protein